MKHDFRTKREIRRDELHDKVCSRYRALLRQNPEVNISRLCDAVADELDMSRWGVMGILIRRGCHAPINKQK